MDISKLQKLASIEIGRRVIQGTPPAPTSDIDSVLMAKVASADQGLLSVAIELCPEDPFGYYEKLGGRYDALEKEARLPRSPLVGASRPTATIDPATGQVILGVENTGYVPKIPPMSAGISPGVVSERARKALEAQQAARDAQAYAARQHIPAAPPIPQRGAPTAAVRAPVTPAAVRAPVTPAHALSRAAQGAASGLTGTHVLLGGLGGLGLGLGAAALYNHLDSAPMDITEIPTMAPISEVKTALAQDLIEKAAAYKEAKARWQREMEAGNLSAGDEARLFGKNSPLPGLYRQIHDPEQGLIPTRPGASRAEANMDRQLRNVAGTEPMRAMRRQRRMVMGGPALGESTALARVPSSELATVPAGNTGLAIPAAGSSPEPHVYEGILKDMPGRERTARVPGPPGPKVTILGHGEKVPETVKKLRPNLPKGGTNWKDLARAGGLVGLGALGSYGVSRYLSDDDRR